MASIKKTGGAVAGGPEIDPESGVANGAESGVAGSTPTPLPHSLESWGWNETWAAAFAPLAADGRIPARVISQQRGEWLLAGEHGEWSAKLTGRPGQKAKWGALRAWGVWVGCVGWFGGGAARVVAGRPRHSAFERRA